MPKRKRGERRARERSSISGRYVLNRAKWPKNTILSPELRPTLPRQPITLLTLPPEIRNAIYAFALRAPLEIFIKVPRSSVGKKTLPKMSLRTYVPSVDNITEHNQIKYVCKQLYIETAALELQTNALTFSFFPRSTQTEPIQQLDEFAATCCTSTFAWIKHIKLEFKPRIYEGQQDVKRTLKSQHLGEYERAARFCRQRPNVKMAYVLAFLPSNDKVYQNVPAKAFANWVIGVMMALRAVDVSYLNPAQGAGLAARAVALRKDAKVEKWAARNLKFHAHPAAGTAVREWYGNRVNAGLPAAHRFVPDWLDLMESWQDKGF